MTLQTITHKHNEYLSFQSTGNAARFIMPFAKEVIGENKTGFDIGCMKPEWAYPDSILIDLAFDDPYDAYNLPQLESLPDYIFSSHCLEHLPDWVGALNYWADNLRSGGVLFLYLPHESQSYWRPWHNRKHYHMFNPTMLNLYFEENDHLWSKHFVSQGADLNHSFCCVAEKA